MKTIKVLLSDHTKNVFLKFLRYFWAMMMKKQANKQEKLRKYKKYLIPL